MADSFGMLDPAHLTICHHDAHGRNILVRNTSNKDNNDDTESTYEDNWVLIDWEYAGRSHPATDIANAICETYMDYDDNVYEMPNVGGDPAKCGLASKIEDCVAAYNRYRQQHDVAPTIWSRTSSGNVTVEQVWVGICGSHLAWAAWSRCLLARAAALGPAVEDDSFP